MDHNIFNKVDRLTRMKHPDAMRELGSELKNDIAKLIVENANKQEKIIQLLEKK